MGQQTHKAWRYGRAALKYVGAWLGLVVLFTVLTTAVSALPSGPVRKHIAASMPDFEAERDRYAPFKNPRSTLDEGSDMHMSVIEYYKDPAHPFRSAMLAVRYEKPGYSGAIDMIRFAVVDGLPGTELYSRYWHGWSLWVRPLLMVMDYHQSRVFLNFVFYGLIAACFVLIYRKLGLVHTVPFALALWSAYVPSVPMCWQLLNVYLVTFAACITLLLKYDGGFIRHIPFAFFFIGAAASFFDLLTAPLVTFGIPAVLVFSMICRQNESARGLIDDALLLVRMGAAWIGGYVVPWATKWFLLDVFFDMDAEKAKIGQAITHSGESWPSVRDAIDQILFRAGGGISGFGQRIDVIKINIDRAFTLSALAVAIGFLALLFLAYYAGRKNRPAMPLIFTAIAASPFAWYFLTTNHAYIHSFFTFRNISISVYALAAALTIAIADMARKRLTAKEKKAARRASS